MARGVYGALPVAGLPTERRSLVRTTSDVLKGGVVGVLTAGDSEPNVEAMVLAFAEYNGRIYVGGKFASVQDGQGGALHSQPYLAAFDKVTGAWISTFTPVLDGTVWDLAVTSTGTLVVAGQFTKVNGVSGTAALAALDPATGAVKPTWRANVSLSGGSHRPLVRAIDIQGGWIYVGGEFTRIVGGPAGISAPLSNLGRVAASDGRPGPEFAPQITGDVIDVEATASRVYAAGHITAVNGVARKSVAVVATADGSTVASMKQIVQTSTDARNHYMQGVLAVGERRVDQRVAAHDAGVPLHRSRTRAVVRERPPR